MGEEETGGRGDGGTKRLRAKILLRSGKRNYGGQMAIRQPANGNLKHGIWNRPGFQVKIIPKSVTSSGVTKNEPLKKWIGNKIIAVNVLNDTAFDQAHYCLLSGRCCR
jgi:hypothetical protein